MMMEGGGITPRQALASSLVRATSASSDWQYIAEGALNVTLKYIGEGIDDLDLLRGRVLRIRKNNKHASGEGENEGAKDPWDEGLEFVENVMLPAFGYRYVQPSIKVHLDEKFIRTLNDAVEDARPAHRRVHSFDTRITTALLMVDNTSLPSSSSSSDSVSKELCVELKCKCGFLPLAKNVTHEVKTRKSRFVMHQQLKYEQGKVSRVSKYDPLDLFSQDETRIQSSLDHLVDVPQNNLRIFVGGKMVFPPPNEKGGEANMAALAKCVAEDGDTNPQRAAGAFLSALAGLLAREPLLARLVRVQQFDEHDIEGTYPVYCQMVDNGEPMPTLSQGGAIAKAGGGSGDSVSSCADARRDALRRFLVSCTAKDCSIMIAMRRDGSEHTADAEGDDNLAVDSIDLNEGERVIVERFRGYTYSAAVVDLDPKPVSKMKHYYDLDAKVATFYAKLEADGALVE